MNGSLSQSTLIFVVYNCIFTASFERAALLFSSAAGDTLLYAVVHNGLVGDSSASSNPGKMHDGDPPHEDGHCSPYSGLLRRRPVE